MLDREKKNFDSHWRFRSANENRESHFTQPIGISSICKYANYTRVNYITSGSLKIKGSDFVNVEPISMGYLSRL